MSDSTTILGITDGTARAGGRGRARAAVALHSLRRGRAARVAAAGTAGVLAVSGIAAASAAAATPASATWRIVKRVHAGDSSEFTAVAPLGSRGGWAFLTENGVTAYKRSGSSWTKVPFPHKPGEWVVAARALSSTDAWAFTASGLTTRAVRWNGHSWKAEHNFAYSVTGAAVISQDNIWAFTNSYAPDRGGAYHYNGHSWKHVGSGFGLNGGSASSAGNVWAFGGEKVAHWTGSAWKLTSVKHLLPKTVPGPRSYPAVVAMWAQSAHSVWAFGDGNNVDEGGPIVLLHYNGRSWKKVASASRTQKMGRSDSDGAISPDGHGGLWIPVEAGAQAFLLLHYTDGKFKVAKLPVPDTQIDLWAIAAIPGSHGGELAAGFTASSSHSVAVGTILQYGG